MARFEPRERPPDHPQAQPARRQRPPPLWRLAPVTFGISVFSGALFLASLKWPSIVDRGAMVPDAVWSGEVWRLVSSVFLHAGWLHITFNLLWFIALGRAIEVRFGGAVVLALTLVTGVAGGAAEMIGAGLRYGGAVGLSGAVYGLFFFGFLTLRHLGGGFSALFSKANAWLLAGWGVLAFVLTYFDIMAIANLAHFAGAASGAMIGAVVRLRGARKGVVGAATLALFAALGLAAWRPEWNPRWQLWRAGSLFDEGRYAQAAGYFAKLSGSHPDDAHLRALYAISLAASGRVSEAEATWNAIPESDREALPSPLRAMYDELVRSVTPPRAPPG